MEKSTGCENCAEKRLPFSNFCEKCLNEKHELIILRRSKICIGWCDFMKGGCDRMDIACNVCELFFVENGRLPTIEDMEF